MAEVQPLNFTNESIIRPSAVHRLRQWGASHEYIDQLVTLVKQHDAFNDPFTFIDHLAMRPNIIRQTLSDPTYGVQITDAINPMGLDADGQCISNANNLLFHLRQLPTLVTNEGKFINSFQFWSNNHSYCGLAPTEHSKIVFYPEVEEGIVLSPNEGEIYNFKGTNLSIDSLNDYYIPEFVQFSSMTIAFGLNDIKKLESSLQAPPIIYSWAYNGMWLGMYDGMDVTFRPALQDGKVVPILALKKRGLFFRNSSGVIVSNKAGQSQIELATALIEGLEKMEYRLHSRIPKHAVLKYPKATQEELFPVEYLHFKTTDMNPRIKEYQNTHNEPINPKFIQWA